MYGVPEVLHSRGVAGVELMISSSDRRTIVRASNRDVGTRPNEAESIIGSIERSLASIPLRNSFTG
jgi:hypothetical protein